MKPGGKAIGRVFGTLLATLMLALSVAVPLLERADLSLDPVAESAHEPGTCARAHDHTICTQVSANVALTTGPLHPRPPADVSAVLPADGKPMRLAGAWAEGHPARGPPHG
jgi:hypothetical protein